MKYSIDKDVSTFVLDVMFNKLQSLAQSRSETLKGYSIIFKSQSTRNILCERISESVEYGIRSKQSIKNITGMIHEECGGIYGQIAFTQVCIRAKNNKVSFKDNKFIVVVNIDELQNDLIMNLWRMDDWLKHMELVITHEFGHILDYVNHDGIDFETWVDNEIHSNDLKNEFYKLDNAARDNNVYNARESYSKYYSIPNEKRANDLAGIDWTQIYEFHETKRPEDISVIISTNTEKDDDYEKRESGFCRYGNEESGINVSLRI